MRVQLSIYYSYVVISHFIAICIVATNLVIEI